MADIIAKLSVNSDKIQSFSARVNVTYHI
jgi:hypothetical protein